MTPRERQTGSYQRGVVVLLRTVAQTPFATGAAEVLHTIATFGGNSHGFADGGAGRYIRYPCVGAYQVISRLQASLLLRIVVSLVGASASSPTTIDAHLVLGTVRWYRAHFIRDTNLERKKGGTLKVLFLTKISCPTHHITHYIWLVD